MTLFAIFYSMYYQTSLFQTSGVHLLLEYTSKEKKSNNRVNHFAIVSIVAMKQFVQQLEADA